MVLQWIPIRYLFLFPLIRLLRIRNSEWTISRRTPKKYFPPTSQFSLSRRTRRGISLASLSSFAPRKKRREKRRREEGKGAAHFFFGDMSVHHRCKYARTLWVHHVLAPATPNNARWNSTRDDRHTLARTAKRLTNRRGDSVGPREWGDEGRGKTFPRYGLLG